MAKAQAKGHTKTYVCGTQATWISQGTEVSWVPDALSISARPGFKNQFNGFSHQRFLKRTDHCATVRCATACHQHSCCSLLPGLILPDDTGACAYSSVQAQETLSTSQRDTWHDGITYAPLSKLLGMSFVFNGECHRPENLHLGHARFRIFGPQSWVHQRLNH